MNSSSVPQASDGADRVISRRTVIRTAAHAAWAVPVISAVSAAPAFAASPAVLQFVGLSTGSWTGNGTKLTLTATVRNVGSDPTVGLAVTFTIPPEYGNLSKAQAVTGVSSVTLGSDRTLVLVASAQATVGGADITMSAKIDATRPTTQPDISVSADASNAAPVGGASFTPA